VHFFTPGYASPEQARRAGEIDKRTDIFSLGVMMFEMMAGHRPFDGDTSEKKIESLLSAEEAPDVREFCPGIPAALAAIVVKAVNKRREQRFSSAGEMLAELQVLKGMIESPNLESATEALDTRYANRLLTQYVIRYLDDKSTRAPLRKLLRIWRGANLKRGKTEDEMLRKSLRGGLMILCWQVLALAFVITGVAAWVSNDEKWEEKVLRGGHTAAVRRAAFSPDGRLLVSVGEDAQVIVWDFVRRERYFAGPSRPYSLPCFLAGWSVIGFRLT
jgi:hypothetical protein